MLLIDIFMFFAKIQIQPLYLISCLVLNFHISSFARDLD